MTREEYTKHELEALKTSPYRTKPTLVRCSTHALEPEIRDQIGTLLAFYWRSHTCKVLINNQVYDIPSNLLDDVTGENGEAH